MPGGGWRIDESVVVEWGNSYSGSLKPEDVQRRYYCPEAFSKSGKGQKWDFRGMEELACDLIHDQGENANTLKHCTDQYQECYLEVPGTLWLGCWIILTCLLLPWMKFISRATWWCA